MAEQQKTVASPSSEVEEMRPDWDLADALMGGTRAMREAGEAYLPRWPNEDKAEYALRLKRSVLFPAYKRTVQTLAAKPFSKPVTVGDDVPAELRPWLDDIDMQGRKLDVFAADCMQTMLAKGLGGILVEHPVADPAEVRTLADETRAGVRPYWVHIKPECILGWKAKIVAGAWVFTQLRLMEKVEEDDGEFATVEVEQVRVLEPGRWRTYRQNEKKEWVPYKEGAVTANGAPLDFIPFVPLYGDREHFMSACPPLIEVAHLNVAHWQSASDQQHILHVARVPILTAIGVTDPVDAQGNVTPWQMTIGASSAVRLPPGADMKFVEHTGAAIKAGDDDLKALEDRMRQAGAELLVIGPAAGTRIEAAADNEVATCALQRLTLALQDALNTALAYTAKWRGLGDTGGSVTLFSDFGALTLGAAEAQMIVDAANGGLISKETAFEELQRRGVVSGERTWEDERDRLDAQGPNLGEMSGGAMSGGAMSGGAAEALAQLDAAINLHEKHMMGEEPTTGKAGAKSQQVLMDQIKAARAALKSAA